MHSGVHGDAYMEVVVASAAAEAAATATLVSPLFELGFLDRDLIAPLFESSLLRTPWGGCPHRGGCPPPPPNSPATLLSRCFAGIKLQPS